jgi:HEPN domain-containing protein
MSQRSSLKLFSVTFNVSQFELVKEWYEKKQYDKIEQYIKDEAKSFLEFLQKIIKNIHKLIEEGD